jgi:hypothetical protein
MLTRKWLRSTRGKRRLGAPRWAGPPIDQPARITRPPAAPADTQVRDMWVEMCDQFALRMLVLTEQLRPTLDRLEGHEDDADQLERLFHVDHGISRMRRAARDLRVLIGRDSSEEAGGRNSSLLGVIRTAASAVEHYNRVSTGKVAELAVAGYATDDVALLMAALIDNATRYSPSSVSISAHLLGDGAILVRIEDSGIGIDPNRLEIINQAFANPIPQMDVYTDRHTGFAVAHRLSRKHGLGVRLAGRTAGASGTVAMVTIPASLLWEIPEPVPASVQEGDDPPRDVSVHLTTDLQAPPPEPVRKPKEREHPAGPAVTGPSARPSVTGPSVSGPSMTVNGLPRRRPGSVRALEPGGPPVTGKIAEQDPAAAGRSFAADVAAFTSVGSDLRPSAVDVVAGPPDDERQEAAEGEER